jgi:DNA-binding LytR/AlgR family response regulator
MNKIPAIIGKLQSQLLYILGIPIFFLTFMLVYKPTAATRLLDMGSNMLGFNCTIIMCILLGVMIISRVLMLVLYHYQRRLDWLRYIYWEIAELITMSLFTALYMTLMFHGEFQYFHILGQCIYFLLLISIYPYIIFNIAMAFAGQKEDNAQFDDSLMRFVDSTQRVKLMIASSAVLYIKAEENYVHIRYLEGERLKDYPLRASMKSLEELMHKHGLIRCQRSYYINPQHIKVLRRDKEGMISAELNTPLAQPIPVSPRYYEELAKWL